MGQPAVLRRSVKFERVEKAGTLGAPADDLPVQFG